MNECRLGFRVSGGTFMAIGALYSGNDVAVLVTTDYGLPVMPLFKKTRDTICRRMTQLWNSSSARY